MTLDDGNSRIREYQALLQVAESIASHRDLPALFRDLARRLHQVVTFDFISLTLPDLERNVVRLHILESSVPSRLQAGLEMPLEDSLKEIVWDAQQPLLVANVDRETRFPYVTQLLRDHGMKSFCVLPLTTAQRRVGSLEFGSAQEGAYSEADLEFLQQVARQVSVAVDNVLNYENAQSYQQQLARERDRLRLLLEVNNALVSNLDPRALFSAIAACLRRVFGHEYTSVALYEPERNQLRIHALDFPSSRGLIREEMVARVGDAPAGAAVLSRSPVLFDRPGIQRFSSEIARLLVAEDFHSLCCLPLISRDRVLGSMNVGSRRPNAFTRDDVDLLSQVANQVAIAIENALAYRQIAELKDKLAEEKLYLEDEIRTEYSFDEIVGESPSFKKILKQVETVAPTDATVLLQGETGTGKEVIARAIHNRSARRGRTFVKVNCAAIPTGLLESELFGHEKGAFTGAISQKIGRLELAHQGTLFLDEVGDIPPELQPKLLRVLQEQEFERLGSTRTIRVDARLVAATNRDLARMVADRQFRSDLYYRIKVFPIVIPPLRERPGDVPLLVRYFTQKHARRMSKKIETIPVEALEALARCPWPGNVRELENFIERAVILSRGPVLHVSRTELKPPVESSSGDATLETAEREHILRILREANWVIGGPNGAAARLGMKRTTLQSKMTRLGISRRDHLT